MSESELPHPEVTSFVLMAAERTGSNLLVGLLDSHPDVRAGGELFNARFVDADHIPWQGIESDAELLAMRRADPVAFVDHAFGRMVRDGASAVGFKLLYNQADAARELTHHLAAAMSVKVIHLTRRNRLRRFVSHLLAEQADEWARSKDAPPAEHRQVEVDFADFVVDCDEVAKAEQRCVDAFDGHDFLHVVYEDLAADPLGVARGVVEFLGVDPDAELAVRSQKTGTRPLRETIANFDALDARLREIGGFLGD